MAQQQYVPSSNLNDDLKQLELCIHNGWSEADKSKRQSAQDFVDEQIGNNIDNFFIGLCKMVEKCEHDHIRSLVTVLIRKRLATDEEPPKFLTLNKNTQVLFINYTVLHTVLHTQPTNALDDD